jgi:two-component system LytT family sensor kinase
MPFLKNKEKYTEYFIFIGTWLFWGVSQSLLWIQNARNPDLVQIISTTSLQTFTCIIINLALLQIMIFSQKKFAGKLSRVLSYAGLIVLFSLLLVFINSSIYYYLKGSNEIIMPLLRYVISSTEKIIYLTGFSTMFFLIRNLRESQKQKSMLEEARQTARDAQLQMLQQQINPHFIFNILNSLRSLITIDTDRARNMVTDLSEFLRVTLSSYKSVQNTIEDEINLLEYYLLLQKVRFEDNIEYNIDVDENIKQFKVPKYILQPLAENAIKHGMKTSPVPLQLNISVNNTDDTIKLIVSNTGSLISSSNETHCNNGIKNIKTRLDLMFPGRANFILEERNGCVMAVITIKNPMK